MIFSEGLAQYRDLLEPGTAVLISVQANLEGDDVRARILTAERLDDAAAKTQRGIRVFLRDDQALESVAKRLGQRGRGRGLSDPAARGRAPRGRDQAAGPLPGDAADRQRDQGDPGRRRRPADVRPRSGMERQCRRRGGLRRKAASGCVCRSAARAAGAIFLA